MTDLFLKYSNIYIIYVNIIQISKFNFEDILFDQKITIIIMHFSL